MQKTISQKVDKSRQKELQSILKREGFDFRDLAYAFWQARSDGAVVSFYESGKVVVQGKRGTEVAILLGLIEEEPESTTSAEPVAATTGPYAHALSKHPAPPPSKWIGIDEAGKGDYFGPLVVVAARVELDQLGWLHELGISDSKRIPDGRILELDHLLRNSIPHETVMLMPSTYNRLYGDIGNLNKLLAWCHATAAADLLEEADADLIISDQFTRATYVADELKKKGIETPFTQRTRAEDDPAVGAASVFARAAFLRGIRKLSRQASIKLPLGASAPVIPAGKRLVKRHGEDALEEYAKTHFKTTKKILG